MTCRKTGLRAGLFYCRNCRIPAAPFFQSVFVVILLCMTMRNIFLKIAYDGTGFHGWQRLPGKRTVCGTVEEALARVLGREVKIDGCSRTDAGVHALGQTASFLLEDHGIPTERIQKALTDCLITQKREHVGEIEILEAKEMPEGFHARYSAKGKQYLYKIRNAESPDIFKRTRYYQIAQPLDLDAMRRAAAQIVGTHDFACFQTAGGTPRETTVRTVWALDILQDGEYVTISIKGDGFLYNMVRIIVGTLVEVGLGKRDAAELTAIIESKDRGRAGHTAPPQGLYLKEVYYDEPETKLG